MERRTTSCGFPIRMCSRSFIKRSNLYANPRPLRLPSGEESSPEGLKRLAPSNFQPAQLLQPKAAYQNASSPRSRHQDVQRTGRYAKAGPRLKPASFRARVVSGRQFLYASVDGALPLDEGLRRAGLRTGGGQFFPNLRFIGSAGCDSAFRADLPGKP